MIKVATKDDRKSQLPCVAPRQHTVTLLHCNCKCCCYSVTYTHTRSAVWLTRHLVHLHCMTYGAPRNHTRRAREGTRIPSLSPFHIVPGRMQLNQACSSL